MDENDEVPTEDLPIEPTGERPGDEPKDTARLGQVGQVGDGPSTLIDQTAVYPPSAVSPDLSERAAGSESADYTPLVGLPLVHGAPFASPGAPGGPMGPAGPGMPGHAMPGGPGGPSGSGAGRARRGWRVGAGVAAAVILAGGLGAGLGAAFTSSSPTSSSSSVPPASPQTTPASEAPSKVNQIADRVEQAVVNIDTSVTTEQGEAPIGAAGTGMILTSNGIVLTNNHVVENATSIKVSVAGHSGEYNAKVLGTDVTGDVALIKIEGLSNLPHVTLASSSTATVGEQIIAIGNAGGLGGKQTVVTGAITATGRSITASDESGDLPEHLTGLLQTDADIVPGDSGGPMVNYSGQVVGMDTAAQDDDSGVTIGFAIPIHTAVQIADEIEQHKSSSTVTLGLSPFLGIYEAAQYGGGNDNFGGGFGGFGGFGNTGNTGTQPVSGVEIGGIVASSPAANVGLEAGDVITSINGQSVTTWSALTKAIAKYKPGQKIVITYVGGSGTSSRVTVTLGGIPR